MRIKAVEITPSGSMVVIGGKNEQGKTSLLDSIQMALGGKKMVPLKPIRLGEDVGKIRVETDDLIITRIFSDTGDQIKVTTKDGAVYSAPQRILNKLFSDLTFDPLEFSNMDNSKQTETLKSLAGLDFTEHDAKREKIYMTRRDINRDLKIEQARLSEMKTHNDVPVAEVSVEGLLNKFRDAEKFNREQDNKRQSKNSLEEEITEIKQVIENLLQKIKENEEELSKIGEIKNNIDMEPIKTEIAASDVLNAKIRENQAYHKKAEECNKLSNKSDQYTVDIEKMDEEKVAKIKSAKLPIEGLGIDEHGITYNSLPFNQCSHAQKLRISVSMGIAMNPELRILLIRDGSLLDKDNLAMIRDMAEKEDAQLWVERVGEGEECSVIIEDGTVKGVDL